MVSTSGLNRFEHISECLRVSAYPLDDFGFVKLCDRYQLFERGFQARVCPAFRGEGCQVATRLMDSRLSVLLKRSLELRVLIERGMNPTVGKRDRRQAVSPPSSLSDL